MSEKVIILIDDDVYISNVICILLDRMGKKVEKFNNGGDAITEYARNYANVDMVITDLSMPGLTGVDVVKSIMLVNPNEAILVITGFIKDNISHLLRYPNVEILTKPFGLDDLKTVIDNMIAKKKERINVV